LIDAGIATANGDWLMDQKNHIAAFCKKLGTPVIIKPAVSGGSMGLSVKNVVARQPI